MATEKRPEDMTVAETMDAIFGDGAAEAAFPDPADLAIAREPHSYIPPTEPKYEVEATDDGMTSGWSASAAGNTDNTFNTYEEAEAARQGLIAYCEDFTEENTRVSEKPE